MDFGRNLTVFRLYLYQMEFVIKNIFSFAHQTSITYNDKRKAVEAHILLMLGRFPAKRSIFNFTQVHFVA